MDQASGRPPASLPGRFREIWQALWEADQRARSRQTLARELGVSTQTLQRILVRGDVPSFGPKESTRVVRSWARTIARLAIAFGREPRIWVEQVGIRWDDQVSLTVRSAVEAQSDRSGSSREGSSGRSRLQPPLLPREQVPLILGIAGAPPAVAGPGEEEFLEAFVRRLFGAVLPGHPLAFHYEDEGRLVSELLRPGHQGHAAAGVAATLPRRMAGLEFVEIPDRTTSLQAFAIESSAAGGPPPCWEDALGQIRGGLGQALAIEGDPGWDHLVGVAALPMELIFQLKTESQDQWARLVGERCRNMGSRLILLGLPESCRRLARTMNMAGGAGSPVVIRALPAGSAPLPAYPLALALCSDWSRWKGVLELALDKQLAPAAQAAPAHHYCRSCAASLEEIENRGVSDRFCRFCSDERGNLKSREEVREILARWMIHWQGSMPPGEAARRADSLMRAMPAWCEN